MAYNGKNETNVIVCLDKKHRDLLERRALANDRTMGREGAVIIKAELDKSAAK